ncbi:MAG: FKBP-type peptidyl-prolyl cis-trans isomerase, partial [Candidatus Bathyarchaeota archaeon]|nr:FKBP-type peptidyl-prolyl cis-trans isomerase [Candidatus Bathyarchaeota archaeon]
MSIVGRGDFILIDYVAKVKETGTVFDTNISSVAKESKIFKEDGVYEPMLVVVGEGWVLKGLDEKLVGIKVGEKTVVELSPEKAFGPRDPNKIKLIPLRKFQQQKISPYPGM